MLQADPNWQANSIYFVDNAGQSGGTVTYDGMTVVLTAFALVQCGTQYHIKIAIGDGTDPVLDSGVFLKAGSFASTGQVIPCPCTGYR
ncbi:MAG: choice-of-anchor L domain-containing protein [Flavobacteriales bacterium]|nr:choice-of-anchor L domain-containing protein [Flavobacteriales bacterium]